VALAIKVNLILGFAHKVESGLAIVALCSAVAGASERVVPSLVGHVADSLVSKSSATAKKTRKRKRPPGMQPMALCDGGRPGQVTSVTLCQRMKS